MLHPKLRASSVLLAVITSLLLQQPAVNGLRILGLFVHPGLSHFHFFHPIMRGLAEAGHDVTVVSEFPDPNPPKGYKDLVLSKQGGLSDGLVNAVDLDRFAYRPSFQHFFEFFLLYKWGLTACEAALNSTVLQNLLNTNQKFDVILTEQFNSDCPTGIAWKFQAPIIGLSSCNIMAWHYARIGVTANPSYIPSLFLGMSDEMTYVQRLANWVTIHVLNFLYEIYSMREADALLRKYIKDDNMPYLGEIVKNTSIILTNTHYSLSGSRPATPALVEVGGVHIKPPKPLDLELQKVLDGAKHGVIYVSWGSMIKAHSLPDEKRKHLLKALGSFKQTVLWKWENETLPEQPSNVIIRKWMPQREILCHPNVRVFLSHGGLLGSSEAAHCGVATVLTPMYGDQFLNSAAQVKRGMGKIVHYEHLTTENLKEAIQFALSPTTQANAKKVSYSYNNRPKKALDTAIWWVEHVAATKGETLLKSHSTYMPGYIYHCLDIYATIFVVVLVSIASWIYVIRKCCGRKSNEDKIKVQ